MLSKPLVKYVLTAALRDRLAVTFFAMIILAGALSAFLGGASVAEESSFALVFGAGGLRILGATGIVLFCAFYIRRSFEHKEVEFLLSRPVSRLTFLASHAFSFIVLALVAAAAVSVALLLIGKPHPAGLAAWAYSVFIEYALMALMAFFFSMVLTSAAGSALAALGFYVLARLIGTLLGIAQAPPDNALFWALNRLMEIISVLIPRFDLMGQTSWLVYGYDGAGVLVQEPGTLAHDMITAIGMPGFIGLQGVIFGALVFTASAFDFFRRQF